MSYFKSKRLGFYSFIVAWVSALFATVCYLLDSAKVADTNTTVVILCAVAVILPVVLEIVFALGLKIDLLNVMPIAFVVLMTFAAGMYLRERVDVLGYIFTDHFSFEKDYPEFGLSLVGYISAIVVGLISNFFKQDKK